MPINVLPFLYYQALPFFFFFFHFANFLFLGSLTILNFLIILMFTVLLPSCVVWGQHFACSVPFDFPSFKFISSSSTVHYHNRLSACLAFHLCCLWPTHRMLSVTVDVSHRHSLLSTFSTQFDHLINSFLIMLVGLWVHGIHTPLLMPWASHIIRIRRNFIFFSVAQLHLLLPLLSFMDLSSFSSNTLPSFFSPYTIVLKK